MFPLTIQTKKGPVVFVAVGGPVVGIPEARTAEITVRKYAGRNVVAQWTETILDGPGGDAYTRANDRASDLEGELAEEYDDLIPLGYGYEVWVNATLWASSKLDAEFNFIPVA